MRSLPRPALRRALALLIVAVLASLGVVLLPAAQAPSNAAVYGAMGAKWTRTHDGTPRYPRYHVTDDVAVPMDDGVLLRAKLIRPAGADGRPVTKKMPVVVNITPYSKLVTAVAAETVNYPVLGPYLVSLLNRINLQGTVISGYNELAGMLDGGLIQTFAYDPKLVRSGYAMLVVDVRGTGLSQGSWDVMGSRERRDNVEIIRWAKRQAWSTGQVGMAGQSYSGMNQLQTASDAPGELAALFPVVPTTDVFQDILAPGGGVGGTFLTSWMTIVNTTKWIPDVASMLNGTFDWTWLADRSARPLSSYGVMLEAILTRNLHTYRGTTADLLDADSDRRRAYRTDTSKVTTPTFAVAGWNDVFTNSQTRLLQNLPKLSDAQRKLIVDDGYHFTVGANYGKPGRPPRMDVLARAWYDKWIKGIDNGIDQYSPATLASEPTGDFIQGPTFPLPGFAHQKQYLSGRPSGSVRMPVAGDGTLASRTPVHRATREVRPGVAPVCSRDSAQGTAGALALLDFCSDDSQIAETAAQTFTSAPVAQTTRISGAPVVHLRQRLQARDGYWHATVNVVSPNGRSTTVSMGQLIVSLRAVDLARSAFGADGALTEVFLKLDRGAYQPVRPGQIVNIDIPMTPTQAALRPGDRLRIDLYSLNAPKSIPLGPTMWASQLRPQFIEIDPNNPSWVNVPVDKPLR